MLKQLVQKREKLVIGLMSGTSADGMDAALVRIEGCGTDTKAALVAFASVPYDDAFRNEILRLASGDKGGSRDLCLFNFLFGRYALDACFAVCEKAGVSPKDIDLVGSHGQTLWHAPEDTPYLGHSVRGTLQLGEASVVAEELCCPVVSDFRVRDVAAGGLGAPLVPYAEYLLYRRPDKTVALQNIGGIGNITILPKSCAREDVYAFDTGPGNMTIDQVVSRITDGKMRFDKDGAIAKTGAISQPLLRYLEDDPYLSLPPPKTTGREAYGAEYTENLMRRAALLCVREEDIVSTVTDFTALCIERALCEHCPDKPDVLIVGGGGAYNPYLMGRLRARLSTPVLTNEEIGFDGAAKEAVAFAILANECVHEKCGNMPSVTGAAHPVVLGKITV
ncbi:MAG: anhydro-N-acetylmuramic acid kinase [Christensenellales bacterium]|jgi:anhydro-N-acetylmuramic acid kinase